MTASIDAPNGSMACVGNTVELHGSANAGDATFHWSNGAEGAITEVGAVGNVTLTVINARGCSATSEAFSVAFYPAVSVTIEASGNTSFCTGGSVTLTSNATSGNLWSTGSTNTSIEVTTSGAYSSTVTDANGCTGSSNTISVSVSDSPSPTITSNGNTTICDGEQLMLNSSAGETYQWYLNGAAIAGATSNELTATQTGGYSVNVTNTDACNGAGNSDFVFVTVNPTPSASFDVDFTNGSGVYDFNNNTVNGVTYNWNFGDGVTSTEVNPSHTYATGGNYTVVLTAVNGGCSSTYELALNSVNQDEVESILLAVYPNPANDVLNIQLPSAMDGAEISLFSLSGQLVQRYHANQTNTNLIQMSTSALAEGIYQLVVISNQDAFSAPIVVRH
ncbi:MAG: PKD domain-containing protein [Flavobacteriales bacterium]